MIDKPDFGDYLLIGVVGPIVLVGIIITAPLWGTAYLLGRFIIAPILIALDKRGYSL
jgi:hypothetical protein